MVRDYPFKCRHFGGEIILLCVRWYLRYSLSYRDLKEMMLEWKLTVDHSTIYRWVQRYHRCTIQYFFFATEPARLYGRCILLFSPATMDTFCSILSRPFTVQPSLALPMAGFCRSCERLA